MNRCFVSNCRKKRCDNGVTTSFFRPTNNEVLQSWKNAVPQGHLLKISDRICESHFKAEDVLKEFVQLMPDGSTFRYPREKPSLKKGAVPSIFIGMNSKVRSINDEKLQSISSQQLEVDVASSNRNARHLDEHSTPSRQISDHGMRNVNQSAENNSGSSISTSSSPRQNVSDDFEEIDFSLRDSTLPLAMENARYSTPTCANEILKNKLFLNICHEYDKNRQLISSPKSWVPQVILKGEKCIMWTLWKPGYTGVEKRIVLFSNMTVQIYMEELPVIIENYETVENIDDINTLISYVSNNVHICQKINGINRSKKCIGYVVRKFHRGRKAVRCAECSKIRIKIQKIGADASINFKLKHIKYVDNCKNLRRQNLRLKLKLNTT